ncbi:restriction endonuclease [Streptomyces cocklensis]|uniref:Restriction system protein n=1 Tax=Actinacidiphila cocklensis TaxID=887465 RepID=A0A9W4EAS3_9ACTN|nr:restriction endonuclease [Actinacidiphila cocklensis]MDD1056808.1 restriction endonuclease [Actinacidiphila cocklensis]CAG6397710.1 Restriction system protein [Actinacidiphila cocklensis]
MTRRSTSGPIAVWAEMQRQQQRQQDAQQRARAQQQREQERRQRAYERDMARQNRERQAAYRQHQEAEALRRTEELDARVAALGGLLATGSRAPAFRAAALRRPERLQPFAPGALARPLPMPDPQRYQAQAGGWGRANRRAQEEAQARYARDLAAAQAAEAQRQHQLADYRRQYDRWAADQLAEIRRHNAGVEQLAEGLRGGDPDAVAQYFSAALYASTAWPEDLPRQVDAAYDAGARQLVLTWELPGYDVVPETKAVRYMPSADRLKDTARPVAQRRALYRDLLAQCVLLALRDLFAADGSGALDSVELNGFVDDHDPATGREARIFLAAVTAGRAAFDALDLVRLSAVDCLVDVFHGRLSARPDQRTAVRPGRLPDEVGAPAAPAPVAPPAPVDDDGEPDLFAMDPLVFEELVAALFRAMGMEAVTTQRSGDGGVDVDAVDPTPIRGGTIVVQVKRYRHTVQPTAVRDLYGTVQHTGANKGVLVTTSRFGNGSHTFVRGKPLELVSGEQLVELLHQHGLRGRLGPGDRPPVPAAPPTPDHNVLGVSWAGRVALDVCALVCRGGTVLGDDHFVFYNNPRTPDGTVAAIPATAPDKAALRVAFDALPAAADRLVLATAIDPTVNPDADLSGFTDAGIRLLDASGAEQGRLDVSDGRPGETALVLGSFRRRAGGDWDFVMGGKGYTGGLEALIRDHGIEVS